MKNSIGLLLTEVQEFLCSEVNRVFAAIVILCILVCYGQVRTEKEIKKVYNYNVRANKELLTEINTNRDKIHFRYFNLSRSLEEIHNVKIDTKNGKLEKQKIVLPEFIPGAFVNRFLTKIITRYGKKIMVWCSGPKWYILQCLQSCY